MRNSLVAMLLAAALTACSSSPPDITGIWTMQEDGRAGAARNGPGNFEQTAPLTDRARAKLAAYHALVDPTGATPGAWCVPHGVPLALFLGGGYPVEFIQRPEQLTIIYETHNEVRRVFLDGRQINPEDVLPSHDGISRGHWEDQTLVMETTGLKESLDQIPHTENARIIERYTPLERDGLRRLKVDVTIEDPEFYTEPVNLAREYTQLVEGRMLEYDCAGPQWDEHLEMLRTQQSASY